MATIAKNSSMKQDILAKTLKRFDHRRRKANRSLREAGEEMGVDHTLLSRLLSGNRNSCSLATVEKIEAWTGTAT